MSGFSADEYEMRHRRRSWRTILLPVMGLLLAGAAGAIAFVASAPVAKMIRDNVGGNIPEGDELQFAVGIAIFLVLMLIFAMFYAIFAPKPTKMISENQLDKEKQARAREKQAQRKRRRQINREMARERREQEN